MRQRVNHPVLILTAVTLGLFAIGLIYAGIPLASGQATKQRWNPRRAPAGTEFVGDQVCAECHRKASASHPQSGMGMALPPVAETKILSDNPHLTMRSGPYTFEIKRKGNESVYSVSDGKETISVPLVYAFGQGKMGQTYVLQREGKFYESRVSFYAEIKGLDFTIGQSRAVPTSLLDAFGRLLSDTDVKNCFSCHSNGAVNGQQLALDKLVHGIRCETCHGPGKEHLEAVRNGEPGYKSIFNPGRLGGEELSQRFCASCHRGAEEFSALKAMELNNVRFQPYRIYLSKCFSDDRNISCVACHNPHESLKEDAAYYDRQCLECHAVKGKPAAQGALKSCPVSDKDCTSCHMPKTEIKDAHFKFTDHYIRVVKRGEKFPS